MNIVTRSQGSGHANSRDLSSGFILAYLLRILHSESTQLQANLAFSNVQSALPLLTQANFQMDIVSQSLPPSSDFRD